MFGTLLENLLILTRKAIIDSLDSLGRDDLNIIFGDGFTKLGDGMLRCHSLASVTTEE
jgi:hypothetical protein